MPRLALAISFALATVLGVSLAHGEVKQQGDLRVAFDARLLPRELPRERFAPITVRLEGSVRNVDGGAPPPLRTISIAVHRAGRLSFRGLPRCEAETLQQTPTETALARCRGALVGRGRFLANVDFPGLPSIPAQGEALAFNGSWRGRPAVLLHIYGSRPVRATFVLPFTIRHPSRGQFGTVLTTRIPKIASDVGYVTDIELTIGRRYSHAGQRRSFLSASCAAPAGFRTAIFDFSRAAFSFADGRSLSVTLIRGCRVRAG